MSRTLLIVALLALVALTMSIATPATLPGTPTITTSSNAGPPQDAATTYDARASGTPLEAGSAATPHPVARTGPLSGFAVVRNDSCTAANGTSAASLPKHVEATARNGCQRGFAAEEEGLRGHGAAFVGSSGSAAEHATDTRTVKWISIQMMSGRWAAHGATTTPTWTGTRTGLADAATGMSTWTANSSDNETKVCDEFMATDPRGLSAVELGLLCGRTVTWATSMRTGRELTSAGKHEPIYAAATTDRPSQGIVFATF